jgi:asparagine synthase (glutamine-hydrolysing)
MAEIRGEFAFVLYDVKRRLLFAARDRFGIKPLYYTVSNGCILFANEMKAFMGLGWQAEWDIDSIVHNGDFGDERTVFKGARKVRTYRSPHETRSYHINAVTCGLLCCLSSLR